jgi:hypothetical protein
LKAPVAFTPTSTPPAKLADRMKKMCARKRARRGRSIARDLGPRLRAYSVLGGGMLATTASAQIVNITSFTGTGQLTLVPESSVTVTFSVMLNAFSPQFGLQGTRYATYRMLNLRNTGNVDVRIQFGETNGVLRKFSMSDGVTGAYFANIYYRPFALTYPIGTPGPLGEFVPEGPNAAVTGYVGFRMRNSANFYSYYGWLRFKVMNDGDGKIASVELVPRDGTSNVFGAYNSEAYGQIAAGQFNAIPEPAKVATGLALFALGAAGVREFRRRHRVAKP